MEEDGDDLLYGDLSSKGLEVELELAAAALGAEQKKSKALVEENGQLKEQLLAVIKDSKQLEDNIMTVYNTALREIQRKDRELADLRAELSKLRAR
jgi:hypothetical protein